MTVRRFKRAAVCLAAAALAAGCVPSAGAATALLGDADRDGAITAEDARMTLRFAVALETPTANEEKICDTDGDGEITAQDARRVLRAAVALEPFWDEQVTLAEESEEKPLDPTVEYAGPILDWDEYDLEDLAIVVCQEAGGESTEVQLMVANVVINRVKSPNFPNTINGVLTQRWQYERVTREGGIYWPSWSTTELRDRCRSVAYRILSGERVCPANVVFQAAFTQGSGVYAYYPSVYGGFYFCYQ